MYSDFFMTTEELILNAIDKCLVTATGEQRRLFLWMKAALQFPGLNQFVEEVKRAGDCQGKVSLESLHKAVAFAESHNEFQIRSLAATDEAKDDMVRLEKIRLKEVEVRIAETLRYLGWMW
jgi:hypothetical protein